MFGFFTPHAHTKKHARIGLAAVMMLTLMSACQKYSDEDYEGHWQLTEIALADGTDAHNVKADGIYWRMQLNVLQIISTGIPIETNPGEVIAKFNVSDGVLHLYEIYHSEREADILITEADDALTLKPYGITAPTEDYHIDHLSSSSLVLTSATRRLSFRKF